MKKRINILTILCCIALFGSCNKITEENGEPVASGVVTIQLNIPSTTDTKGADLNQSTPEENYIGETQVVFFAPTDNQTGVVERVITFNAATGKSDDVKSVWKDNKLSVKGIDTSTPKGVCVVANATTANRYVAAIVVGKTTEGDLLKAITESATLPIRPTTGNGMLMSYMVKRYDFSKNYTLTVPLVRQLVKINFTVKLNQTFADRFIGTSFDAAELVNNRLLNIYNIQRRSFVHSTTPASAPTMSTLNDFISVKEIPKTGSGATAEWRFTIYTYEHPTPKDKSASTWFVLNLPYKSENVVFTKNYYKFYINNKYDTTNPHKTLRNHIYDLTATVNGFGGLTPDDGREVGVATTILNWNMVNMDEQVGSVL